MNEQLLKYVYNESEKNGFAVIDARYEDDVVELEENELIERDPEGPMSDGSIRLSVTDDGIKWVEALTVPAAAPVATPTPARPRGRPRKVVEPEVMTLEQVNALPDAPPPFMLPTVVTNTQRLSEPLDGRAFEAADSRNPEFTLPASLSHGTAEDASAWQKHAAANNQTFVAPQSPPWAAQTGFHPQPVDDPRLPEFNPAAFVPYNGDEPKYDETEFVDHPTLNVPPINKLMPTYSQPVGITTHLLPPTKNVRIKAKDAIAGWPFEQLPVFGQFHITDEQAETFKKVLSAANRVFGKLEQPRTFQMFEAKKVQNAGRIDGWFVFRMS